jgi:hypothetical protein
LGLPEPDDGGPEPIYLVITPPNIGSTTYPSAAGYHSVYDSGDYFLSFQFEHEETIYGWSSDSGSIDSITTTVSHEIAEAMTDPQNPPGNGAVVSPGANFPAVGSGEIGDFEAQNYTYRVNGIQIQSLWSDQAQAFAVADGTSQTFTVNNGVLTVNGDQFGVSNDTITVDTSNGGVSVTLNGETATFDPGVITGIVVQPGGGSNTINIEHTLAFAPVTINDAGTDSINVSPTAQFLDNIKGSVTINGNGTTTLTVDDQADNIPGDVYTVTSSTVTRDFSALISYQGLSGVTLNGGSASDTVNVNSTASGASLTLNLGAAADTVNLTPSTDNLINLQSGVTVNGGGATTLNVDDQLQASYSAIYSVTSSTVTRSFAATVTYHGLSSLVVNGGSASDVYYVISTAAATPVTLNLGPAADAVTVSPYAHFLDNLKGNLTINCGSGDTLTLDDQQDTYSDTYILTATTFTRTAAATVTYHGLSGVTLNGGSATEVFNVNGTAAGTPLTINEGTGVNTVNVGAGNLANVAGAVTVNGHNTADVVNVLDQFMASNDTYTVTYSTVSRPNFGGLTYSGIGHLNLDVENGTNTVNILSTTSATPVLVYTGAGIDTVNVGVGSLDAVGGAVTVIGHNSADLVNVVDRNLAYSDTYTVTNSTLSRPFFGGLTYSGIGRLNLYVENGTNTINVLSTAATTLVVIYAGTGVDTVNVGNGTLDPLAGPVAVSGYPGSTYVNVNDQASTVNNTYTLTNAQFTRPSFGGLSYATIAGLTVNAETGLNQSSPQTLLVQSTAAGTATTINTTSGYHNVSVGAVGGSSNSLSAIRGALTVNGPSTVNLSLYDTTANAGRTYTAGAGTTSSSSTISATADANGVAPALITYSGTLGTVAVFGTAYNDTANVASLPLGTTLEFDMMGGYNTAQSSLPGAHHWLIYPASSGVTSATLDGRVIFGQAWNLTGGPGSDTFTFVPQYGAEGSIGGVINGGGGGDWLDYSQYTHAVSVNLATGAATGVGNDVPGHILNIQNVIGALAAANTLTGDNDPLGNILVGGNVASTITGGNTRSILISGHGGGSITGGTGDDIVIGGYTDYDHNQAALQAIMNEWLSTTDSYLTRISKIRAGISAGGSSYSLVWGTTVHDNGVADRLRGDPGGSSVRGMDWFFANLGPGGVLDTILDLQSGEKVNNQP